MGATTFLCLLLPLWVQDATAKVGFTRSDFPQDFVFGSGTSAYQYEGARVLLLRMAGAQAVGTISLTQAKWKTKAQEMLPQMGTTNTWRMSSSCLRLA